MVQTSSGVDLVSYLFIPLAAPSHSTFLGCHASTCTTTLSVHGLIGKPSLEDHKFDGESEERIVASGGEVRFQEGCHRVFVRGQVHPGLACSRSLGDGILSGAAGVSAEPTVSPPLPFGPGSSLILASDGLWDMVSPGVAAQASAAADADSFASSLTKVAHRKWQVRHVDSASVVSSTSLTMALSGHPRC